MTDNSKTPPAKKTIQDPPEYAAVNKLKGQEGQATYQQNGQSYQQNGQSAVAPGSKESGPTGSGKAQGEGARNPQTGERIARNPQTGE